MSHATHVPFSAAPCRCAVAAALCPSRTLHRVLFVRGLPVDDGRGDGAGRAATQTKLCTQVAFPRQLPVDSVIFHAGFDGTYAAELYDEATESAAPRAPTSDDCEATEATCVRGACTRVIGASAPEGTCRTPTWPLLDLHLHRRVSRAIVLDDQRLRLEVRNRQSSARSCSMGP